MFLPVVPRHVHTHGLRCLARGARPRSFRSCNILASGANPRFRVPTWARALSTTTEWTPEARTAVINAMDEWTRATVVPGLAGWEEAGEIPRGVYQSAGSVGLLGAGYPEPLGGTPMPLSLTSDIWERIAHRTGSGGVCAALGSHSIAMPPILALGSTALQERVVPPVLRGEKVAALAITEPCGGSDVAAMQTRAQLEGDDIVLNGSKTFITSGVNADFYTVAARVGARAELALVLVEKGTPGFSQQRLSKQGWWCSDTASLFFDDVRVPRGNLIGDWGHGFKGIMCNFNSERILLAVQALGLARACYDEALAWARERTTFGKPLIERQVIRHKLVDMFAAIESTAALAKSVIAEVESGGPPPVPTICVLKNQAVDCVQFVSNEGMQILGGTGYMRGCVNERVFREVKVLAIGGGATEIMKDLAARQLGF